MEPIRKKPNELRFEDISVGDCYTFQKQFTQDDLLQFSALSGDFNPLHVDETFEMTHHFNGNLVHGMLTASLFSTFIGMYCPGRNALYLSQTLKFLKPVFPNDLLTVVGTVKSKTEVFQTVTLKTEIFSNDQLKVSGKATAKILSI